MEGPPDAVMAEPGGPARLSGDRRAVSLLERPRPVAPSTATSRRSSTSRSRSPRARRWPSSAPTAPARPRCFERRRGCCRCRRRRALRRRSRSAAARPTSSWTAASCSCPRGGASSRACPSRRTSWSARIAAGGPWTLARVYRLFPVLAERRRQPGTNLSGGEQQMLAIGRGLMANPRLLLVDEISLGLAPSWSAASTRSCGRSRGGHDRSWSSRT